MEPGDVGDFFDPNLDFVASKTAIGKSFKTAVEQSGVKKIVHLSSNGAHTEKGTGMLVIHYNVESLLKELPSDVIIKFVRAATFFTNIFYNIQSIKAQGEIFSNYDGNEKEPWVSPSDIADVIVEEIESPFEERKVRYIASDELSPIEVNQLMAEAIGKTNNPAFRS